MALPALYSNEAKYREQDQPVSTNVPHTLLGEILERSVKLIEETDKKYEQISVMTVGGLLQVNTDLT